MESSFISHCTPCLAAAVLVACALPASSQAALTLVSKDATGTNSVTAPGHSTSPRLTGDGRGVLFLSNARLVPGDGSSVNLYFRERLTGNLHLVSAGLGGGGGNGHSDLGVIAGNGRFVVFESEAGNLVAEDVNQMRDVFSRDLQLGRTELASVNAGGTASAAGASGHPSVSSSGRWVAFDSDAPDLTAVPRATPNRQVYLRDRELKTTACLSSAIAQRFTGSISSQPVISADGTRVAFLSQGATPLSQTTYRRIDLFFWEQGRPTLVNVTTNMTAYQTQIGNVSYFDSSALAFSEDGQFIVFKVNGPNRTKGCLFRYDVTAGQLQLLAADVPAVLLPDVDPNPPLVSTDGGVVAVQRIPASTLAERHVQVWDAASLQWFDPMLAHARLLSHHPSLTADGQKLLFLSYPTNAPSTAGRRPLQPYLLDRQTAELKMLELPPGVSADLAAPTLSADGSTFACQAKTAGPADLNEGEDIFVMDLFTGNNEIASPRFGFPVTSALGRSWLGSAGISSNGQFTAFVSSARNLAPNDTNELPDIFVHDGVAQRSRRLPLNSGVPSPTDIVPYHFRLSGNGQALAFSAWTTNLHAADTNRTEDVYLYQVVSGELSVPSLATGIAPGRSSLPSLSHDGTSLVFESPVPALTPLPDNNGDKDILLYNAATRSTALVSVNIAGTAAGSGGSHNPLLSPNGRWVLFESTAVDLVQPSVPFGMYYYVRDLAQNTTHRLSLAVSSPSTFAFSADGDWAVILQSSPDMALSLVDLAVRAAYSIATNVANPSVSANGEFVIYEAKPTASVPSQQIALWERATGASHVITTNTTGLAANGSSFSPSISADGKVIVFCSRASDLVSDDTNGVMDVFLFDRTEGKVSRLSQGDAAGPSYQPRLSADGRVVVFESLAKNLTPADENQRGDVFRIILRGNDSDEDGMEDDWEITFFGNLDRSGAGDADNDGLSDFAEHGAGTNPISDASVLRVWVSSSLTTGETRVHWSAVSGKTYQLQFKDDLAQSAWSDLGTRVVAASASTSVLDPNPPAHKRFYRTRLVP